MSRQQTPHGDDGRSKVRCNIRGAELRPGKDNMERHVEGVHVRTKHPVLAEGIVTMKACAAKRLKRRELLRNKSEHDFDVSLARDYELSFPAKVRHGGGYFTRGALTRAGPLTHEPPVFRQGIPEVFAKDGAIRPLKMNFQLSEGEAVGDEELQELFEGLETILRLTIADDVLVEEEGLAALLDELEDAPTFSPMASNLIIGRNRRELLSW
ncbi:SET domain-containing protein [Fusarium sp. Ph1]|nr:SET domain-containing protein [Fusarium sp. Ph1]